MKLMRSSVKNVFFGFESLFDPGILVFYLYQNVFLTLFYANLQFGQTLWQNWRTLGFLEVSSQTFRVGDEIRLSVELHACVYIISWYANPILI